MKIINPISEYLSPNGISPYTFIEKVARTCYKSESKISKDSYKKMLGNLIQHGHYAMLEHYTVFIKMSAYFYEYIDRFCNIFNISLEYFNISRTGRGYYILSGSFRSFLELFEQYEGKPLWSYPPLLFLLKVMKYHYSFIFDRFSVERLTGYNETVMNRTGTFDYNDITVINREDFVSVFSDECSEDMIKHHFTHTVKFTCNRGVSHEFVRHRKCAFAQESTRYCNYSKDQFNNVITVIRPLSIMEDREKYAEWLESNIKAEEAYFNLLELGATPQEARDVLPNALKTELVVTCTEEEWQHIINLRYLGTTGLPHPHIEESMSLIVEELEKRSGGRLKIEKR